MVQFHIVTEDQSETSYGAIEEALFAVANGEVVLADLDGRIFSTSQLVPGDDPATIARRYCAGGGQAPQTAGVPEYGDCMSKDDTELRCFGRKWYVSDGERSRIIAGPFMHRNAAREWTAGLLSQHSLVNSVAPQ